MAIFGASGRKGYGVHLDDPVDAGAEQDGRDASPTAGVVDGQSMKTQKPAGCVAMTPARRSSAASSGHRYRRPPQSGGPCGQYQDRDGWLWPAAGLSDSFLGSNAFR